MKSTTLFGLNLAEGSYPFISSLDNGALPSDEVARNQMEGEQQEESSIKLSKLMTTEHYSNILQTLSLATHSIKHIYSTVDSAAVLGSKSLDSITPTTSTLLPNLSPSTTSLPSTSFSLAQHLDLLEKSSAARIEYMEDLKTYYELLVTCLHLKLQVVLGRQINSDPLTLEILDVCDQLKEAKVSTKASLAETNTKLRQYLVLGDEFMGIVDEYASAKSDYNLLLGQLEKLGAN